MAITPTSGPVSKTYTVDKYWLTRLSIESNNPDDPSRIHFEVVPYNSDTNEMLESQMVQYSAYNLMEMAANDTEIAAIMNSIIAKVDELLKSTGKI